MILKEFEDAINDSTGGNDKIQQNDYFVKGALPIIDQGQQFIAGFTNNVELKYKGKLPCIVFGDHTKIFKYIDFDFALGADGTKILTTADDFNTKYVYYYLRTIRLPSNLGYSRHFKYLKGNKILFIPPNEQERIANILDKSDSIHRHRQESILLANEYIRSTFLEMFGDPRDNNSGLPETNIGSCCDVDMGGTPSTLTQEYYGGKINWMKSGDIKGNFIYSVKNTITEQGLKNSNAKIYPINSIVIALNGQGKTRASTAMLKIKTASNQSVACINPLNDELNPYYLLFNLKLRYDELRKITGDGDRSGLNLTIIRNFKIGKPEKGDQIHFQRIVEKVESIILKYELFSSESGNLFTSLMQYAFTGKL